MPDAVETIVGGAVTIMVIAFFLIIASAVLGSLNQTQCQPYIQTIQQKDASIEGLNNEIAKWQNAYNELNDKYQKLITENITKQDIEDIKTQASVTQNGISNINQRIDILNQNYITNFTKIQNAYYVSFVFSISLTFFLVIDLLSVAFFKVDIKLFAFKIFWGVTYGLIILNIWHAIPQTLRQRVPSGIVNRVRTVASKIEHSGRWRYEDDDE